MSVAILARYCPCSSCPYNLCARAFASTLHTATGEAYDRHLSVEGLSVLHSCHNDVSRGLIVYISCVRSRERPTTCIWCKLGQVTRFSLLYDQPWRDGIVGLLVVVSNNSSHSGICK